MSSLIQSTFELSLGQLLATGDGGALPLQAAAEVVAIVEADGRRLRKHIRHIPLMYDKKHILWMQSCTSW